MWPGMHTSEKRSGSRQLGRWRSGLDTSDQYVRNDRILINRVQELVATQVRKVIANPDIETRPDIFGECAVLDDLRSFCLAAPFGNDPKGVEQTISNLTLFGKHRLKASLIPKVMMKDHGGFDDIPILDGLDTAPPAGTTPPQVQAIGDQEKKNGDMMEAQVAAEDAVDGSRSEHVAVDCDEDGDFGRSDFQAGDEEEGSVTPGTVSLGSPPPTVPGVPTEEDLNVLLSAAMANPLPPPWNFDGGTKVVRVDSEDEDEIRPKKLDYVVSKKGNSRSATRRLHRVGWCWRWPGVDYTIHDWFKSKEDIPDEGVEYDVLCKQCWPDHGRSGEDLKKRPRLDEALVDNSSSSSSSKVYVEVASSDGDEEKKQVS